MSHRAHAAEEIRSWRLIAEGDREETLAKFRERWQSVEVSTSNQASRRAIPVQNELTPIVEKRVEAMPQTFEVMPDEGGATEEEAAALDKWLGGCLEGGRSLYGAMGEIAEDQEIIGNAALVAGRKEDGTVWVRIRDTCGLEIESEPLSPREIRAVVFRWQVGLGVDGGATRNREYVERFGPEGRTLSIDGVMTEQDEGLGFIPVVIIPRRVRKNSPLGDSAMPMLEEAYMSLLWALYLINRANRFAGKVWCPDAAADDGWALPDQDGNKVTTLPIVPGAFHPIPLRQVGSQDIPAGALEQYREALDTLYRVGKVRRPLGDSADMRSGKAMLIDTLELRRYTENKAKLAKQGLESLCDIWGWLSGRRSYPDPMGVTVQLPDLVQDDPGEQRERAGLWLDARRAGECTRPQFFRAWQRLGMVDDDDDPDALAAEVEEDAEAEQLTQAERVADAMRLGQIGPEPEALPPPPEGEVVTDG